MNDRLRDIPSTQEQLGNVGRTTVFELIRKGELRSVKVGKRRLVPQSQIDAYIAGLLDQPAAGNGAA
jgi:excisionase family DNA binding protein